MTTILGWFGSIAAAAVVIALCVLLTKHHSRLPSATHPWVHRFVIIGVFFAGTVISASSFGLWLIHMADDLLGYIGGTANGGLGWAIVTIAGLVLLAALIVALFDGSSAVGLALVTPLVLAMSPAGFNHQVYLAVAAPAAELIANVAHWAGG